MMLLLAACPQPSSLSVEDLLGEWDFPDTGGKTDIHLSVLEDDDPNDVMIDLSWSEGEDGPFYAGEGTLTGDSIDGEYVYWPASGGTSGPYDFTVKCTILDGGKLKITVTAEDGELDGSLTFADGVISDD